MATYCFTNDDNTIIQRTNDDGSAYAVHISNTLQWDELVAEANGTIQAFAGFPTPLANPTTEQKIAAAGFDEGELEDYLVAKIQARLNE